MIPAVTAAQMREVDRATIQDVGVPGVVLMENAGRSCVETIFERFPERLRQGVAVLCGKGNNGGDGFVIARHLTNYGVDLRVYLFGKVKDIKGDARINLDAARAMGIKITEVLDARSLRTVNVNAGLIVDAIFGTGLERPLGGHFSKAVDKVNRSGAAVLAVDMPSGLQSDSGRAGGTCVDADVTVTFGLPKIGQLIEPGRSLCGSLIVADISIPNDVVERTKIDTALLEQDDLLHMFQPRRADTHKGTYGRVAVFGSSPGLTGAAAMAGMAAVRTGAGLVRCAVPDELNTIFEIKMTEVMSEPLPGTDGALGQSALDRALSLADEQDVLLLGPGLGSSKQAGEFARIFSLEADKPLVIDADGLNAWAGKAEALAGRRAQTILLPHPGEAARLLGVDIKRVQSERLASARTLAELTESIVVLKGAATVIAAPDGFAAINQTGNPGMASGGTGDVLAGMVLGMWAQHPDAFETACAAAYLHGMAGDRALARTGERGLAASDLLEELPGCLRDMEAAARGEPQGEAD